VLNGHVDGAGRALVRLGVKPSATATAVEIDVWVDTGFTRELVLPQERIAALSLPVSAVVRVELGDGSRAVLYTYTCLIEWFAKSNRSKSSPTQGNSHFSVLASHEVAR
jgi:predicted aspartyl protease